MPKEKQAKEKPIFFGCCDKSKEDESREAYHLVLKSGIDCEIVIASDVESPEIVEDYRHYTGLEEIKGFINKRKPEQKIEAPRGIIIETRRFPPENPSSRHVSLKGLVSLVKFATPVQDFKGELNSSVCLKTTYFGRAEVGYYWSMWLDNEKGYSICESGEFNSINEDFSSYSEERLRKWQQVAIETHREYLLKIEDLSWQGRTISKDFLK